MDFDIPEGETIRSAADLFEWEESEGLAFKELFTKYKDKCPMLICIQGGNYGTTRFYCFDNFQVLRIHGVSYQPRVAADDTRRVKDFKDSIVTLPENTHVKFQQITGPGKYSPSKSLREILANVQTYPVNLVLSTDHAYQVRVGTSRQNSSDFEYMLVKERYKEPFFMMNCIDMSDLKMNSMHCMACLCDDLVASPIKGFKYKSKVSFKQYCQRLAQQAATSGEVYDTSDGNPDWCEHSLDDFLNLLDVCEYKEGIIERVVVEPTEDDEYEEIAPLLPLREPVKRHQSTDKNESTDKKPATEKDKYTAKKSKEHEHEPKHHDQGKSKSPHEEGKSGFFTKLIYHGHKTAQAVNKSNQHSKSKMLESKECGEKVPERPAKPVKSGIPPPRKKKEQAEKEKQSPDPTLFTNREYQNTKVGRVTVKPFQQVETKEKLTDMKKDESDDYYVEPSEYVDSYGTDSIDNKHKLQHLASQYVTGQVSNVEEVEGDYEELSQVKEEQTKIEARQAESVNAEVTKLSIDETCTTLKALKLDKYVPKFRENMIDGSVLCDLSVDDLMEELKMKRLEAIRLHSFAKSGKIPT